MFKYLLWAWPFAVILLLLYIVVAAIPAIFLRAFGLKRLGNRWAYLNASFVANLLFGFLNINVHVSGDTESLEKLKKNRERICYVANHTSMLDIPIILGPLALNCGFVIKKQMAFVPLVNIIALSLNSVFINRKSLKKSVKAIKRGVKRIDRGAAMLIFPEGTRSKTGEIGKFKRGAFKLAVLSESNVVPVTIKGVRAGFEERDKCFKRIDCYLNVGTPVSMKGLNREEIFEAENKIEDGIREAFANLGK